MPMIKTSRSLAFLLLLLPFYAAAEVGTTDGCQKDVKQLEDDIRDNSDDYTMESKTRAHAELAAAKTNRLNPVKCRGNIQDAKKELREGKRDRKEKEKEKARKD